MKRTARVAGVCCLLVAVLGGFAELYVRGTLRVPDDAAATARNIAANAGLFRLAFVADLLMATSFLFLGLALYRLFRQVNREVSAALVVFVSVGATMNLVNLVFHFAALLVTTDASYAAALGPGGADMVVSLLVDLHENGYRIAGILFGLWLLPLGCLAYTSGWFPRALGVLPMVSCVCYLLSTFAVFPVPHLDETISLVVTAPTAIAEFWMVGYLVAVGVRTRPAVLAAVPAAG